jgi:hypothetical protein
VSAHLRLLRRATRSPHLEPLGLPLSRAGVALSLEAAVALVGLHAQPGTWPDRPALDELESRGLIRHAWRAWSLTDRGLDQLSTIPSTHQAVLLEGVELVLARAYPEVHHVYNTVPAAPGRD